MATTGCVPSSGFMATYGLGEQKDGSCRKKAALTVCSVAAETNSILSADSLSPPTKNKKKVLRLQTAVGAINLLTFVTSLACVWQHLPEFVRMGSPQIKSQCAVALRRKVRWGFCVRRMLVELRIKIRMRFFFFFSNARKHEDAICTQSEVESFAAGGSLSSELPQWRFFSLLEFIACVVLWDVCVHACSVC